MTHFIVGSGSYGCLYDYGPHAHETLADAVEDLAGVFELSERRTRELRRDRHLDLRPGEGADYCEITACDCADAGSHNEEGEERRSDGDK